MIERMGIAKVLSLLVTRYGWRRAIAHLWSGSHSHEPTMLFVLAKYAGGHQQIGPAFYDGNKARAAAQKSGSIIKVVTTEDHLWISPDD